MNNHSDFDLHYRREMDKIGLETYFLDKTNIYDIAIDNLIKERKAKIKASQEEYDGWDELKEKDPKRYKELIEQADRDDINLDHQQHDYILDVSYNEEILQSLTEMKIIYAFKFLEINIKKLLRASFSLKSTREFYKWDIIIKFLKDRNIDPTLLDGYKEAFQLKTVNNSIKHSDEYETSLKSIPEFNSDRLTYRNLDAFYERIKPFPDLFFQDLINSIHSELYDFNENKLDEIAKSYILRMGKEDAAKLANKLIDSYK